MAKTILLLYEKETGHITGVNTSSIATFENMYPDATEEFKQKYGGIVIPYNADYDKNRNWYKIENGEVIKLESPFIKEDTLPKIPDPKDQQIADLQTEVSTLQSTISNYQKEISDLQVATAAILGGAL